MIRFREGKRAIVLLMCLCMMLSTAFSLTPAYAADPEIAETAEIELEGAEVYLPQPKVYGEWNYTIDIFSAQDQEMASPLAENVLKYSFRDVGEYVLKYTFVSNGTQIIKTCVLTIRDTTAPKVSAVRKTEKIYQRGEKIGLYVKASDSGQIDQVTMRLYLNGKDVTADEKIPQQLPNTAEKEYGMDLVAEKAGQYKAVVNVADRSGNSAEFVFEFSVESEGLTVWQIILIAVSAAAAVAAAITVFVLVKRKGRKNAGN